MLLRLWLLVDQCVAWHYLAVRGFWAGHAVRLCGAWPAGATHDSSRMFPLADDAGTVELFLRCCASLHLPPALSRLQPAADPTPNHNPNPTAAAPTPRVPRSPLQQLRPTGCVWAAGQQASCLHMCQGVCWWGAASSALRLALAGDEGMQRLLAG